MATKPAQPDSSAPNTLLPFIEAKQKEAATAGAKVVEFPIKPPAKSRSGMYVGMGVVLVALAAAGWWWQTKSKPDLDPTGRPKIEGLPRSLNMAAQPTVPTPAPTSPANVPANSGENNILQDVPALTMALKDPNADVRLGAAIQLRSLGSKAMEAAPTLKETLSDPNLQVRVWSALALAKIAPSETAVIPGLTEALKEKSVSARHGAVLALGLLGIDHPEVKTAVPTLLELHNSDPEEEIRKAATAALKIIAPESLPSAGLK